jgi:tRNA-splicing ligase RtcB
MSPGATIRAWLPDPLPHEVKRPLERIRTADDVQHVAVMPDVHHAGNVSIGVVLATTHVIYPEAVGGDIGCGICAAPVSASASSVTKDTAGRILHALYESVPLRRHHSRIEAAKRFEEAALDPEELSAPALRRFAGREGVMQFGGLGSGNHFLELQADEADGLWVMIHSGSRALGQAIRDHHLHDADLSASRLFGLDANTDTGRDYLRDMDWALTYAEASRRAMLSAVGTVMQRELGAGIDHGGYLSCHHNHVLRETHGGRGLWVHRKGAIPAGAGVPGIIPGSMGTLSFHVRGRGNPDALCSSSHGAGRTMSRKEASQRITRRHLLSQMEGVWFDHRRVDSLRDEAPAAYKDIEKVMRAQKDLTRIVRRLRPVLVYKGR